MESKKQIQKERQYYIDWLRILLILTVFLYHIGMIFNSWSWHVKNDVTFEYRSFLWYVMVFLGRWRMPLLVLISGAGTYFALGRRNSWQYVIERFKRLFIPLFVGIFTLVPIQVYIEKSAQYDSLLSFYPHMFEGVYPNGNFSWHHLWFIAYLFFISLIFAPFIKFFKSKRFDEFKIWLAKIVSLPAGANIFLIPILLSEFLLRPLFPDNTNDFMHDWAAISFYIIFFLSGFIMLSNKQMVESVQKQRRLYLIESLVVTILMFTVPYMPESDLARDLLWLVFQAFVSWTWGITAIGYAKEYLNQDGKIRKFANEAIYPFYLIHQPIIVVVAYFIVGMNLHIALKALVITLISFFLSVLFYRVLVYPFNYMRVIFGMKEIKRQRLNESFLTRRSSKRQVVISYKSALVVLVLLSITIIVCYI